MQAQKVPDGNGHIVHCVINVGGRNVIFVFVHGEGMSQVVCQAVQKVQWHD